MKRWARAGALVVCRAVASVVLAATKATLPFVLYGDGQKQSPFIASGWMGNTGRIAMDATSTDDPHQGNTCLKVEYKANDGWAGVVWQSPANDWGDKPGGLDLTGAKKLTFWARGAKGGEKVTFGVGMIGSDKKYADSAKAEDKDQVLTKEWKQYTIDLAGKDLTQIKSGFYWVVAGQGAPLTFYLDDITYE